ncbi:MAG: o-succinylbenzoate synthase [Ignavibacteriales bacterium]|nr:o-succinylbenzoate synthase [Ignavibacteriales bacterium]
MTIKEFKYFPFSLNFKTPFLTSNKVINERNGFIISIYDELGNSAFGEASPLPGFSIENIGDVERILKGLRHQIIGFSVEENLTSISNLLSEFKLVPSIVFALEQAIVGLCVKRNKSFISGAFGNINSVIEVNAILGLDDANNILTKIEGEIQNGYGTIKLKVGRNNFEDDFNLLKNVREKFGELLKIRIDANGKWPREMVNEYLNQISQFNIQYIEEPCANLEILNQLSDTSPIQIAIDESILSINDAKKIINDSNIEFIVLKPMILGGIISSFLLIKEAGRKNKNIIISSSFESAVGKSALVLLAAITDHSFAHGLDTSKNFEKDICKDPYEVKNGKINFNIEKYPPQFDLSRL